MKIQRTKNAIRNVFFDGLMKMVNTVVPFFMRSIMLHFLGVQYLGLNGLFKSILSLLNLAELGVGSAMVFSMYKPIADDDTEAICALMKLYKKVYRFIGLFIAVVGLALTPFLPSLISGELPPDINLYILYFMNLGNTVLTYWLFAYKRAILDAHQRKDVGSKIMLAVNLIEYALKVLVLVVFHNFYLYMIVQLVAQVAINLITATRAEKLYPQYRARGDLPREKMLDIARRVRDLFTAKLSYVIFNSADMLVISSFIGLKALAIYQNYYYIVSSLRMMLDVIVNACTAGIGNSLVTENEEKNYKDLRKMTLLFGWLMAVTSAMLLCMYQPFMHIWMGEENMLTFNYVVCFVIYYYTLGMNRVINMFKDAAGIWRKDRWRPLVAAIVNLGLNLATVQWLGLYGVLLSSIISVVVVQIPWLIHNLFGEVFSRKYLKNYTILFCGFFLLALIACAGSWAICSFFHLSEFPALIVNACISFAIPNAIILALFGRNDLFKETISQFKRVLLKDKHSR